MNPNEYQKRAMAKEADQMAVHRYVSKSVPYVSTRFTNGLIGLTDECGELASLRKRWLEYQGRKPDGAEILEECGDVLWRTCQILSAFGLTLEQAMEANLAKLEKVRYKDTVCNPTDAAEENRNRKAEAEEVRRSLEEFPETARINRMIDGIEEDESRLTAEDDGVNYEQQVFDFMKHDSNQLK